MHRVQPVSWRRLADTNENGRGHYRLRATVRPGLGESADDVVIWIDRETAWLFRIHMSLNGFETTLGAHVDTTFLEYCDVAGYLLPGRFHERVRGPLRIDAHTWWTTGIDTDRGWHDEDALALHSLAPRRRLRRHCLQRRPRREGCVMPVVLKATCDGHVSFRPRGDIEMIFVGWALYRRLQSPRATPCQKK